MVKKKGIYAAVLCIALTQMSGAGLSPMLSSLGDAFPQLPAAMVQLVSTLPAIFTLLAGYTVGVLSSRISRRKLLILGTSLILAFAVLGARFHESVFELYLWSAFMGFGVGICNNTSIIMINDTFSETERIHVLGKQTFFASLGMMGMTFVGGFLVKSGWYLNYLVYLCILPAFFLTWFVVPDEVRGRMNAKKEPGKKAKIEWVKIFLPMSCGFLITFLYTVCTTNTSMFVVEEGFGSSAQAGTIMTLVGLSGGIGGLLLGRLTDRIGPVRMILSGFSLLIIGYLFFFFAHSFGMVLLGGILSGCSISFIAPNSTYLVMERAGDFLEQAVAISTMCSQFGILTSPILTVLSAAIFRTENVRFRYLFAALLALAFVVVLLVTQREHILQGRKRVGENAYNS